MKRKMFFFALFIIVGVLSPYFSEAFEAPLSVLTSQYRESVKQLDSLIANNPDDYDSRIKRASLNIDLQNSAKAKEDLDYLDEKKCIDKRILALRGVLYISTKDYHKE